MEIDRQDSTYTELTGGEESHEWISVDHADTRRLQGEMRSLVDKHF